MTQLLRSGKVYFLRCEIAAVSCGFISCAAAVFSTPTTFELRRAFGFEGSQTHYEQTS